MEEPAFSGTIDDFTREFAAGTVLFSEGEKGSSMYVIRRGRVKIYRTLGSREKILGLLGPGEFFGEMSLLNDKPRTASAATVEDANVLVLGKDHLDRMIRERPDIAMGLIRSLSERLRKADNLINALMIPEKVARVVFVLAQTVRDMIPAKGTGPWRTGLYPGDLASDLGMTIAEADEILAKLSKFGVDTLGADREVLVNNYAGLVQVIRSFELGRDLGERYPDLFGAPR